MLLHRRLETGPLLGVVGSGDSSLLLVLRSASEIVSESESERST